MALSCSSAQPKIRIYPGDCAFFERINIKAATPVDEAPQPPNPSIAIEQVSAQADRLILDVVNNFFHDKLTGLPEIERYLRLMRA